MPYTTIELRHELGTRFNLTWPQTGNLLEFILGNDCLEGDVEEAVYSHYMNSGEMPYGVAKARDGDPAEWIANRLAEEYDIT